MSRTAWGKAKRNIDRTGEAVLAEDGEKYKVEASEYFDGKEYSVYHLARNGKVTFWDCIKTAYSLDGLEYLFVDQRKEV